MAIPSPYAVLPPASASRPESEKARAQVESLEHEARQAVEEARMVLPGIQALFGFQLIAVFNQRYTELPSTEQHLHLAALILTATSVALIMTPAAYHRQAEPGQVSRYFVTLASRIMAPALLTLALGICFDVFIVAKMTLAETDVSALLAGILFVIYLGAWFVFPRLKAHRLRSTPL